MNQTRPTAGGSDASHTPPGHGIDAENERRPGVPMAEDAHPAEGVHWDAPTQQPTDSTHYRRKGLDALTPLFGTAQPPRGVSGWLRALAYRSPEHNSRHWAMLMFADRVDVLESRARRVIDRRRTMAGLVGISQRVERNLVGSLLLAAVTGYAAGRLIRRTSTGASRGLRRDDVEEAG